MSLILPVARCAALSLLVGLAAPAARAACPTTMPDAAFKTCVTTELAGLAAAVVSAVQAGNELRDEVDLLEAENAELYALNAEITIKLEEALADIDALEDADVAGLGDYLSVDAATDSVVFTGANVYVQSGSGATDDYRTTLYGGGSGSMTGLGNLIVGYNEDDNYGPLDRSGSHNLVVGSEHGYDGFGGIVGGYANTNSGWYGLALGGTNNIASGAWSTVCGGVYNEASGSRATVAGGTNNEASGQYSVASGGDYNLAEGDYSAVYGATQSDATANRGAVFGAYQGVSSGDYSAVLGGYGNEASGTRSVVTGGYANIASGSDSAVSGGYASEAYGDYSAVSGGYVNVAGGDYSVVYAGVANTASSDYSYQP